MAKRYSFNRFMRGPLSGLALILLVGIFLGLFAGCAPRGEAHTVDEIYREAKLRYETARQQGKLDADISKQIDTIVSDLEAAIATRESVKFTAVSDELLGIVRHAGYPTRPSMGEAISALRDLGAREPQTSQAKLLASRVYHILATEIETTHFGVKTSAPA